MAQFKLSAGATLDLLTKDELDESLTSQADREWIEYARGIKVLRITGQPGAAVSATAVYVVPNTPNQGYVWNLRLLGVSFSVAAACRAAIGDTASTAPGNLQLGQSSVTNQQTTMTWSSGQAWLNSGENLLIFASGAATLNGFMLTVVETPAEMAWKLV